MKRVLFRKRIGRVLAAGVLLGAWSACRPAAAAQTGALMARYTTGGAALGALLGSVSATIPYLNDKQSFDFVVGGGAGALAGCGVGLILGMVDVATRTDLSNNPAVPLSGPSVMLEQGATFVVWNRAF